MIVSFLFFQDHRKNDAEKHRKRLPNIRQIFRCWLPPAPARFCSRPGFRNLLGVLPCTDFGLTWGHPWSTFWNIWIAMLLHVSKIPEQHMSPTTPSKKQARINKDFTDNRFKQIRFYVCCLTKPRKSETQVPFLYLFFFFLLSFFFLKIGSK